MTTSARPAQNRVAPWGDTVATPMRGTWMGNRGRLHEGDGSRVVVRSHRTKAWITCVLTFRDRVVPQWQPNRYTPLFFLDEAVSFAAGHRPCAECRHADFVEYKRLWGSVTGVTPRASEMDAVLHPLRLPVGRSRPTWQLAWSHVPVGAFVMIDAQPLVVLPDHLARWDAASHTYADKRDRPSSGDADVITPAPSVAVLSAGYPVQIAPSARYARAGQPTGTGFTARVAM